MHSVHLLSKGQKRLLQKTQVVDKCPSCPPNFLNIFDAGYRQLLPSEGFTDKIDVNWKIVSCLFQAPLAVQNKEGTSQYYFSMQVQNSNWPVETLQVSTDGGRSWQNTISRDYNYFEKDSKSGGAGFGTEKVDLKITCFNGNSVYMRDVEVKDKKKIWADGNC
jgi:expansin (peptidoglycan-binding protein)